MLTEHIEEYIELLESLKGYKISSLIEHAIIKIFAALKNPNFSPVAAPFFTKINEQLSLEDKPELDNRSPIQKLIQHKNPPFTNSECEQDPDNVSQIKKLLNGLYYAHISFSDIEHTDLKKNMQTSQAHLGHLYFKTVNDAYEACYLLTHLDVDIQDMFREELQFIYPIVIKLQTLTEHNIEHTKALAESMEKYPLSYTIGEGTGIAIEQLQPNADGFDYDFLTQFSAILPSYIDKATQYLQQYSSQLIHQEPGLNKATVAELQKTALELLNDLENIKGGSLIVSLKFLKYIHIIRHIITLSMSTLEQIGNLSDSSQDVIRDNLAQLKYAILPQLFGLVDKIEVNCMLKPGTLSVPLMKKVQEYYKTLIYFARMPVDFEAKGEELLSIEDSRFVALRLERTYQRIDKANKALAKITKVQEAATDFFALMKHPYGQDQLVHKLPKEIKNQLIEHYKIIKPYLMHVDVDLNQQIITSLLGDSSGSYINSTWNWITGQLPPDHINLILNKEQALTRFIDKKIATQHYHIKSNASLIDFVQRETNLILFPYSDTTSIITTEQLEQINFYIPPEEKPEELYVADESTALQITDEEKDDLIYCTKRKNKTIANPDQLNADQTLLLYQWYKSKLRRFQDARTAYNEFTILLANQLKELYPIPPHIVTFNHLQESSRQKLTVLYSLFKAYFMNGLSEEMKVFALAFDTFLSPTAGGAALEAPLLVEFNKFNQQLQVVLNDTENTWTKQSQFYLKQAKHKFNCEEQDVFFVDESRALRSEGEATPNIIFSTEKNKKRVANPEQLTGAQALTLHQWYRNKRNKFEVASKAYNQFSTLLSEDREKYPSSKDSQLTLNLLENETKTECRKLYNLFQPYFIHGSPANRKQDVLAFDKRLVQAIAEKPHIEQKQPNTLEKKGAITKKALRNKPPTLDLLEQLNEHFQIYFTDVDLAWSKASLFYLKLAQEKFANEYSNSKLTQDLNTKRAHHLIKHTDYSQFVFEFRQAMQELTALFNKTMQAELKIKAYGIPFPELEDPYSAAAQGKQIMGMKGIYNSLYHIEQIVRQLENLNDKSAKSLYVYYLIKAYSHFYELTKLSQSLADDPHFKIIYSELLERAQNIWATIQENLEAYQGSAEQVTPIGIPIKNSGLWYTLNAFNVIPKQIRSLNNTTYLTQDDLDELHINAKKASLTIEALIANSNSPFKLFLQTPEMYALYCDLSNRLADFINTTHDAAVSNLGNINTHVFTPMLLEADQWEDKIGLMPGTFSEPLKNIINEYYKGLLHPLKLPSKTHIQFICDKEPIHERIDVTQQKSHDASQHLQSLNTHYVEILKLYSLIDEYNKLAGTFFSPNPEVVAKLMGKITTAYKEALPKLISLKRQLKFEPREKINERDQAFDAQLNAVLKSYNVKLSDIKALVKISHAHYLGLKKTYDDKFNTAQEKLAYLTGLSAAQDEANVRFIIEYTTESFDKQLEELASRHVGLQYIDKEYCARLKNYLLTFKESMIQQAKSKEDINLSIRELLKEKIRRFEQEHFVKYYQLDSIRGAFAQFKHYFRQVTLAIEQQRSVFENDDTLAAKTAEIKKLELIAENEHLSIEDRIQQIKSKVINDPGFSRIILESKQIDQFSFANLLRCILSLLEALHLYSPDKKAHLNTLKNAVIQKPRISELTERYGLFTKIPKTSTVETQCEIGVNAGIDVAP